MNQPWTPAWLHAEDYHSRTEADARVLARAHLDPIDEDPH